VRRPPTTRGLRVGLGVVAAATLLDLVPGRAAAQEATNDLVGIQGRAAASGLHATYNPAGVLPISAPVDLGAPDALATIASGPATFARASVLDPGDLLASPDALLAQAVADYPAGTVPAYPLRISAASGVGAPSADLRPAPGLHAHVEAADGTSAAEASLPGLAAPGLVTAGSMAAQATTETDGRTVTVRARSTIGEINVLGLLTIGSVVTDLTATSDGGTTEVTGGTEVVDASLLGTPVTIDADGIRPNGSPSLLGGLLEPLVPGVDEALAHAGIRITVAAPVQGDSEEAGLLLASGLRIDLELSEQTVPILKTLLDAVPSVPNPIPGAPGLGDVLALARARHLVSIDLGGGSVSLTARGALPSPASTAPAAARSQPRPGSGGVGFVPSPPPDLEAVVPTANASKAAAPARPLPASGGLGIAALLALLAQPLVGDRIARAVRGVSAADQPAPCPRERR
jgi:hypothetical protein